MHEQILSLSAERNVTVSVTGRFLRALTGFELAALLFGLTPTTLMQRIETCRGIEPASLEKTGRGTFSSNHFISTAMLELLVGCSSVLWLAASDTSPVESLDTG